MYTRFDYNLEPNWIQVESGLTNKQDGDTLVTAMLLLMTKLPW